MAVETRSDPDAGSSNLTRSFLHGAHAGRHFIWRGWVSDGEPDVVYSSDSVYRPFTPGTFFSRYLTWGIYGLDGKLISAAAYRRGPEMTLMGQSEFLHTEQSGLKHVDEEHIYFGPFIPHYGHFIVTSLARAWFISKCDHKRSKLLCHSDHEIAAQFRGFMGRMAEGLGLMCDQFTLPKEPMRFTNLTIPHVAFLDKNKRILLSCGQCRKSASLVFWGDETDCSDRPIYLSKARLQAGLVSSMTNELTSPSNSATGGSRFASRNS